MAIYFVRHGESVANEQNLFTGTQNTPLTGLGVRQAHQAGALSPRVARDLFITRSTPNIFLWFDSPAGSCTPRAGI